MAAHDILMSAAGGSGAAPDAQFNYVTMLLHGDGTNGAQNNTFLDGSTNNFTITRNGNTTQGSFSPYGSNWSNSFGGSSDYLSLASSTPLSLGTGDFTVEGWFYANSTASQPAILNLGDNTTGLIITLYLSQIYCYYLAGGGVFGGGATVSTGNWYHFAWVRNGGVQTFYLNGVSDGTPFTNSSSHSSSGGAGIGWSNAGYSGFNKFNGYISNVRVVKGTAVYTSAFTPPTTPLTAITNTSLLTCQSNRFIDNSTNAASITPTGSPSVQRFNPFGASTAYSTSVIGGSGYFLESSSSYIQTTSSATIGSGNFTVEGWFYRQSTSRIVLASIGDENTSTGITFYIDGSTGYYNFVTNGSVVTVVSAPPSNTINCWQHIAFVRNGSTVTCYINGVSSGTTTTSSSFSGLVTLGAEIYNGTTYAGTTGYVSNIRITTTAVYTTTFTPPTAPVTAISGTQFLANMTNAAIYDNAEMNDLQTAGTAQISTSVKKYGTGSMSFPAQADRLVPAYTNSICFALGSGDFTIEGWMYMPTISGSGYGNIMCSGASASQFLLSCGTTGWAGTDNKLNFNPGTDAVVTSTTTVTNSTWHHFAVVRTGSSYKMFIDGTLEATGAATAIDFKQWGSDTYVGIGAGYHLAQPGTYIDDLRITKGYARYTTNFTPPTAAFPNTGPI